MGENNKKIIEGIKVTSVNRALTSIFNSIYSSVNDGMVRKVEVEAVPGDVEKIIVSYTDNGNSTTFGKAKADTDFPQGVTFNDIHEIVKGSYLAEVYGVEGNTILLRIKENETMKDVNKGISASDAESKAVGILSSDELAERISYLEEHGIKKGSLLFKLILENIRSNSRKVAKPVALYKRVGKGESLIKKIFDHLVVGNYPILEGPKSVGKNVAWESVAWVLNCDIITLQCSERLTRADMLGFQSSDNSIKTMLTEQGLRDKLEAMKTGNWTDEAIKYQLACDKSNSPDLVLTPGPVTQALERTNEGEGTILILDEMNLADGNVLAGVFNTIADHHTAEIFVTGYGYVPIPRNLIMGATQNANTDGDSNYVGINQQNMATISRFTKICLEETGSIASLLAREANIWGVPDTILYGMDRVYSEFKTLAEDGEDGISRDSLNIRGFESAVRCIGIGKSVKDSIIECVINTVTDFYERETLVQHLNNLVDSKGNIKTK